MSVTKHTPGPWASDDSGRVYAIGGGYVPLRTPFREDAFTDGPNRSDHPEETLLANAILIAAAPDLLRSLKGCADALGLASQSFRANNPRAAIPNLYDLHVEAARAAIAKAEGLR